MSKPDTTFIQRERKNYLGTYRPKIDAKDKALGKVQYLDDISRQFDALLLRHGYRHDGTRFFCEAQQQETIAVFSHGGSGACVLAHLLALPIPYVCTVLPYEFTSVIILEFPVRTGCHVHPRIELFNDAAHILDVSSGLVFQEKA